jgi:hypothetical protein
VYVYPADLLERTTDFSVDGILVESLILEPYQPPTVFQVNVSNATSDVLQAGGNKVGFRFQIDPQTPHLISQAFMDALDSDPATKPVLVVTEQVPGDLDGDRDVDLVDFRRVTQCLSGPDRRPADCRLSDFDFDADVDMLDLQMFEDFYNSFAR